MRIGIVNDSRFAAETMRRAITAHSHHEVAWIARSGDEAMNRCALDRPDAILMDLVLPGMDGIETTRRIMTGKPCAIVVVSANVEDNAAQVFEALGAGALDAMSSPVLDGPGGSEGTRALIKKLDKISRLVNRADGDVRATVHRKTAGGLVAIGASAGGPAALASVLRSLPRNFDVPVIVIQHVDPQFAAGLASWLNDHCHLPVRLAQEGDHPQAGQVLVAAREEHLVFTSPNRLGYTRLPSEISYRPSVDVFLKSVKNFWRGEVVAVLLTGMGRDGAEGLRLLRESGHHTIAQDRRTCAVYGMPKAAADLNAASEILALDKIGPRLAKLFSTARQQ
jgi:two-component system, chemotaxis family, response regulator WspF